MLLKIKEYYSSLKTYQKIELYLIPIVILLYLLYLYFNIQIHEIPQETIDNIEIPNKIELPTQQNQTLNFLKKIETKAKRYTITIDLISTTSNQEIVLSASGGFKSMMNFIYELEKEFLFKDISLNLAQNYRRLNMETTILIDDKNKNIDYKALLRQLDNINNPFIPSNKQQKNIPNIKIKAVFDNYVLIDKEFIAIGEYYKKYKLISIDSESVVFLHNGETLRIKL